MKKLLFVLLGTGSLSLTTFAQNQKKDDDEKKEKITAPVAVQQAFAKKFPDVKASWSKEGRSAYEAEFKSNGHEMSAVFETDGTLTETETEIKISDLPTAAATYIKANYKSATIKEAAKIVNAKGEASYEAEVNGIDLLFDANGKFIKEEKD